MPARLARFVTWLELDSMLKGHAKATQQALVGSRMVANQVYNVLGAFSETHETLTDQEYYALPLVDGPPPPPKVIPPLSEETRQWLEKRYGAPVIFESDNLAA